MSETKPGAATAAPKVIKRGWVRGVLGVKGPVPAAPATTAPTAPVTTATTATAPAATAATPATTAPAAPATTATTAPVTATAAPATTAPAPTAPATTAPTPAPTAPTTAPAAATPPPARPGETAYRAARAKLARREAAVQRIGAKPDDQAKLKAKYVAAKALVDTELGKPDYVRALALLPPMEKALEAASQARCKANESATRALVRSATRAQDVTAKDTLGTTLRGSDGKAKKAWNSPGSPQWVKMVDKTLRIKLDPDFQADYDRISDKVADAIANDPIVKDAFKNWNAWAADKANHVADVEKLMKRVVKLQSDELGIIPPTPVKMEARPTRPTNVGSFDTTTKEITLNSSNSSNWDLRELLDTLTHENTHAYQTKLIEAMKAGTLKSGHPDYNAAMALALNENAGYISGDESDEYPTNPPNPYNDQVCEAHAWRAGARTGKAAHQKLAAAPPPAPVTAPATTAPATGTPATGTPVTGTPVTGTPATGTPPATPTV